MRHHHSHGDQRRYAQAGGENPLSRPLQNSAAGARLVQAGATVQQVGGQGGVGQNGSGVAEERDLAAEAGWG